MWAKLLIFLLTLTYCFPLPVRMIYSFYKYFISLNSLIIYTSCLSLAGHCPVDKDTIHALFCLFSDDDVAPSPPVLFSGLSACPPQQVLSISLLMRSPQPLSEVLWPLIPPPSPDWIKTFHGHPQPGSVLMHLSGKKLILAGWTNGREFTGASVALLSFSKKNIYF